MWVLGAGTCVAAGRGRSQPSDVKAPVHTLVTPRVHLHEAHRLVLLVSFFLNANDTEHSIGYRADTMMPRILSPLTLPAGSAAPCPASTAWPAPQPHAAAGLGLQTTRKRTGVSTKRYDSDQNTVRSERTAGAACHVHVHAHRRFVNASQPGCSSSFISSLSNSDRPSAAEPGGGGKEADGRRPLVVLDGLNKTRTRTRHRWTSMRASPSGVLDPHAVDQEQVITGSPLPGTLLAKVPTPYGMLPNPLKHARTTSPRAALQCQESARAAHPSNPRLDRPRRPSTHTTTHPRSPPPRPLLSAALCARWA